MKVKFKKLVEGAKAPYQGTVGSAGFDLTAIGIDDMENGYLRYHTGLAVEIPVGYVGLVFPRSSVFKTGMLLSNCVGVIDSDYRGEITAVFTIGDDVDTEYKVGDRICQLIIMPYPEIEFEETEELTETKRGIGGYGSTGR